MVLEIENLAKKYQDLQVFKNVSFSLEAGEVVCIEGKSGQGKSTLLRCINYLEKADQGSIKIDNLYLCQEKNGSMDYCSKKVLKEIRRKIGLVFQSYYLFPHMTVWQNITMAPFYLKKQSKEQIEQRANEFLTALDLENRADAMPHELSGGQRQRVAIARACMLNPSVLCFDEPTSAVDRTTAEQIAEIIRMLAARHIGILIVSHDQFFIDRIADRVLCLTEHGLRERT